MKRLGVVIVLVALLSVLALPFATGLVVQTDLERRVAEMNRNAFLDATLLDYERGWRTSTARLELGLSPSYVERLSGGTLGAAALGPAGAFVDEKLIVLVDVEHGPVLLDDGFGFGMASIFARSDPGAQYMAALESVGMPYLFEFRGRSGFGSFSFEGDIPPAQFANDLAEIEFSGIDVTGTASRRALDLVAMLERLDVQSLLATISVEGARLDLANTFEPGRDLQLGASELTVRRVTASSAFTESAGLLLTELRMASDVALEPASDTLTLVVDYGAGQLATGDAFRASDMLVRLTLEHVDASAVESYSALIKDMATRQGVTDPDVITAALLPLADEFLRAGPVLTVEPIQLSMPAGAFSGRLALEVDTTALPPTGARIDYEDPSLLMDLLSGEADVRIAKSLLREIVRSAGGAQMAAQAALAGESLTPEQAADQAEAQFMGMLMMLTATGMLTDDGDDYVTRLSYADRQALVNGAPLPLPFLAP